jgi:hypothetical protein
MPKNLKHLMQRLPRAQYDDSDIVNIEQRKDLSPISSGSFNPQEPDATNHGNVRLSKDESRPSIIKSQLKLLRNNSEAGRI